VSAERFAVWFLSAFACGPRMAEAAAHGAAALGAPSEWRALVDDVVAFARGADGASWGAFKAAHAFSELAMRPALAGVVAEVLIDSGMNEQGRELVEAALGLAPRPGDRRLRQLRGLCWSRTDRLGEAVDEVRALLSEDEHDEETIGILAGAIKRQSAAATEPSELLGDAHKLYAEGFKRSGGAKESAQSNTYLGINAAATALWLGRTKEARETAVHLLRVLDRGVACLERSGCGDAHSLDVWQRATIAEASLLAGRIAIAARQYAALVASRPPAGSLKSCFKQLRRHLRHLRPSLSAAAFLRLGTQSLWVGVTGHRRLENEATVEAAVRTALRGLAERDGKRVVVLTALAEGADRLVARVASETPSDTSLEVALPLEQAEYERDFTESVGEFRDLLGRANAVSVLDGPARQGKARHPEAYAPLGRHIAESCDVLLAIWDGQPARGPGGTGEVVALARARGVEVAWIRPDGTRGNEPA